MAPHEHPRLPRALVDRARMHLRSQSGSEFEVVAQEPEVRVAYRVLNFAVHAGAVMLASGAGTLEVEATILSICKYCGLRAYDVDVTFTSITASYMRGEDVEPVTAVTVVRHRSVNYTRLAGVQRLTDDLGRRRLTPEQAMAQLHRIEQTPARRGRFIILGWAGMAAAFSVLLGGNAIVAGTAFVATLIAYPLIEWLRGRGIPEFFCTAVGAAVAAAFAMMLVVLHAPAMTSIVVAGGIMVLVPGYSLVASVQDALTGFPISGLARGFEVVLTAAGIITGVALVLYLATTAGVPAHLQRGPLNSIAHLPLQVVAAGVAAMLYATATSVPRRALLVAGLVGAEGWLTYLLLVRVDNSQLVSTALAAGLIGFTGQQLATRLRTHPFLFVVPGVMPLVPGLTIYEGMLDLFYGHTAQGITSLLRAAAVGLAIAAGVTLGHLLTHPLRRPRSGPSGPT